ncbi:MAG: isopentenyldiphosphate isomerase [Clostridia bacterium]|nr:isopentenyldiphosphate isomerase [Clostridia bacterium]
MELWDILDKNGNKLGRTVERGKPMSQDEFHLVVHVWIMNSKGEYLISKRTPNKPYPNMWEATGGSAVIGDDSISAAIREVNEELGVVLNPANGKLFKSYLRQNHDFPDICDVWIFKHDCPIEAIVFQEGETCDAMWAGKNKIYEMIKAGLFIGKDIYPYLDELLIGRKE